MDKGCMQDFDEYDLRFVEREFCEKFDYSPADFENAVQELNTFFCLIGRNQGPLAVSSRRVDDLWHTFILFTPQYRQFCTRYFGRYVDHQPNTPSTPVSPEAFLNTFRALHEKFGHVPNEWTREIPGGIL